MRRAIRDCDAVQNRLKAPDPEEELRAHADLASKNAAESGGAEPGALSDLRKGALLGNGLQLGQRSPYGRMSGTTPLG